MTWVIVAIAAVLVAVVLLLAWRRQRSRQLKDRFGPEYDRAVDRRGGQRAAEAELVGRQRRREQLEIKKLDPAARDEFLVRWKAAQTRFVDSPTPAVAEADALVMEVMRERGYPMDEFEQRAADVSVDHPDVVENYRAAHEISTGATTRGDVSTEELRQAMVHYRALFSELLDAHDDQPRHARAARHEE